MMCAEACPTIAIWADWDGRKIAEINKEECIGCGLCKRQCHLESIVGEVKKPHEVMESCTGCGKCAEKCPKKCITMKVREHTRDAFAKIGTTPEAVSVEVRLQAAQIKEKPKYSPEVQAKIDAALKAKQAREEAAKASSTDSVK
jgi:Na+-translocating ferredoxin:NAD+ oxidoreductase RNF subunit RnfB